MLLEVAALVRANWLSRTSYRLRTAMSLVGVVLSVVPLFFIAGALQPVMAGPIRGQGDQYFGFVVVGTAAVYFVRAGAGLLPGAVQGGIQLGTLEALLSTPASLPGLLVGMVGAGVVWMIPRALVLLLVGWALGAGVHPGGLLPVMLVFLLTFVAYLPFGLFAAALVLAFRTSGPVPALVVSVSLLLGGVYYPTDVIPSWIARVADVVPLTYATRAARRVLLEGAPLPSIAGDVAILATLATLLLTLAGVTFAIAFRYAKRAGTLAQY